MSDLPKGPRSRVPEYATPRDQLIIFDRRGIEFLPPFQLSLQTSKMVNTLAVRGALSWRNLANVPLRSRVWSAGHGVHHAAALKTYTPFLFAEDRSVGLVTAPANRFRMRQEIRSLVKGSNRIAIIYDNCAQLPLVGRLGETSSCYYLYDDFRLDLTGRPHGRLDEVTEARMLAAVDVVFAVSRELCEYAARYARRVHYLPNGYNADLFGARAWRPAPPSRSAVVGYSGVISGRVDLLGLHATAIARPEWKFQLLGPIEPAIERELERTGRPRDALQKLLALPNVKYLPPRPLAEVPGVVAEFDVALVPYCLNRFTLASSPLKLYEYYAVGIPVVSTRIPEVMRFDPDVILTEEGKDYVEAIDLALDEGRDPASWVRRSALAEKNSTFNRAVDVVARLFGTA